VPASVTSRSHSAPPRASPHLTRVERMLPSAEADEYSGFRNVENEGVYIVTSHTHYPVKPGGGQKCALHPNHTAAGVGLVGPGLARSPLAQPRLIPLQHARVALPAVPSAVPPHVHPAFRSAPRRTSAPHTLAFRVFTLQLSLLARKVPWPRFSRLLHYPVPGLTGFSTRL
jgi:hypothetical protein